MRVFFPWVAQANYYAHALQGKLWVEQRSNRLVVVNVVDSTSQKRGNGNNVDLAGLLFLRNNNGVANYQLVDLRVFDALVSRTAENRMRSANVYLFSCPSASA